MNIPLIIVLLYVVLLFVISFWAKRRAASGAAGPASSVKRTFQPMNWPSGVCVSCASRWATLRAAMDGLRESAP